MERIGTPIVEITDPSSHSRMDTAELFGHATSRESEFSSHSGSEGNEVSHSGESSEFHTGTIGSQTDNNSWRLYTGNTSPQGEYRESFGNESLMREQLSHLQREIHEVNERLFMNEKRLTDKGLVNEQLKSLILSLQQRTRHGLRIETDSNAGCCTREKCSLL